jgi:hypothetical protein
MLQTGGFIVVNLKGGSKNLFFFRHVFLTKPQFNLSAFFGSLQTAIRRPNMWSLWKKLSGTFNLSSII